MRLSGLCYLCFALLGSVTLLAENWQTTNLQVLRGSSYNETVKEKSTITIAHANRWIYGSNYLFVDIDSFDKSNMSLYAEISPSLSFAKVFGVDLENALLKDLRFTSTFEFPSTKAMRRLVGIGFDFKVPGFVFFNLDLLRRDDPAFEGATGQVTLSWLLPFHLGNYPFRLEGFVDFAGGEGASTANTHFSPQILIDLAKLWDKQDSLYAGIEYAHWTNQYGTKDRTLSVSKLMLKWVF